MSSYCECGHVLGEHQEDGNCLGDGGTCECKCFTEIPPEELERGYD